MSLFCIDVGGTEIKYARADGIALTSKDRCPTQYGDNEHFLQVLAALYREHGSDCSGITISMPGLIDSDQGYVVNAGGMLKEVREMPLASQLEACTGVPVSVENDAKSAALAELHAGELKGCATGAVLILGTGIGGALIQDGKLYRGAHLFAGEFSYVHINQDRFAHSDSVLAVRCGGKELRKKAAEKLGRKADEVTGYTIFDSAEQGDQAMLEVIRNYARDLARFIYNLQCIYDPEKIVIGGGISARDLLIRMIQEETDAIYDNDIFTLPRAVVTGSRFHNDANLIGACCRYHEVHDNA